MFIRAHLFGYMLSQKCDYEELRRMKLQLHHYIHAYSEYIEFFEGVAEINYVQTRRHELRVSVSPP